VGRCPPRHPSRVTRIVYFLLSVVLLSRARQRPPPVLFDLDGTLVDSIELILQSMQAAIAERPELQPTRAEWITGIGTPLVTQFRSYVEDETEVTRLMRRYRTYQTANHDRLTACYTGVLDAVHQLSERGHPLAIVTSKPTELARRSITHVGLAQYFPVIVGVESTTRHKPDPEPVRFALERLEASTDGAFFVGDSPHDIAAGNAAGVSTVAVLWGAFTREALEQARPGYILDRIDGLVAIVGDNHGELAKHP
jgi:pyrophosphatase PpaX